MNHIFYSIKVLVPPPPPKRWCETEAKYLKRIEDYNADFSEDIAAYLDHHNVPPTHRLKIDLPLPYRTWTTIARAESSYGPYESWDTAKQLVDTKLKDDFAGWFSNIWTDVVFDIVSKPFLDYPC